MTRSRSRRIPLERSREEAFRAEVDDALHSTMEERIEAMVALLDMAFELWTVRGLAGDKGLCRFPGMPQQRRRGLCRDRRDRGVQSELLGVPTSFAGVEELIRMKRATANVEKDLPDVQRLEALRKSE